MLGLKISHFLTLDAQFWFMHLFPVMATALENRLIPISQEQFSVSLWRSMWPQNTQTETLRNKQTPTPEPPPEVLWTVINSLICDSQLNRAEGGETVTSVIVLQEDLALPCTEAKSTLCSDAHLVSAISHSQSHDALKTNENYEIVRR